jgi:hypothetical protein
MGGFYWHGDRSKFIRDHCSGRIIKPATKHIQLRPYRSSAGRVFGRSAPQPSVQITGIEADAMKKN